ncbi:16S rRNA m(4)C1402 methyltransferase [Trichlorobacter ammonificans]|uniref:Ribosomal RNA small subunit methyltransferase H n=2 Tax=Trichlorobacter ammonificans TaxID=2916410 RepID=A0ABM9DAL8_9BACT|nr:16S rRNA m(4)C1402 methyltransferase [Trichlorobacter ammonificans]
MAAEVLQHLAPRSGGMYVDGTLGGGGHSEQLLEASAPDGRVLGIDRDPAALAAAGERLNRFGDRFHSVRGSFGNLAEILRQAGIGAIDGFLLDLGVSSHQLDSPERGFSFRTNGPLDMRMDPAAGESAAELVNRASEQELERIIRDYGEERWARKIATRIVAARSERAFTSTLELAELVERTIPRRFHEERIHPATRTFQALRMAVNSELEQVRQGVVAGIELLAPGGRLVVISFHSLEDRIVKQLFREAATGCVCPPRFPHCTCGRTPRGRLITGKPVIAGTEERSENPRARSAKLRALEKL